MTPPAASRGREARATPRADAEPGPDPADLAARLHDWQRMIRRRLATRSALAHVLLATHATLDPQRVADFLVSWAPGWWPFAEHWWLLGGWATGVTLIVSGLAAGAGVLYAFRHYRQPR